MLPLESWVSGTSPLFIPCLWSAVALAPLALLRYLYCSSKQTTKHCVIDTYSRRDILHFNFGILIDSVKLRNTGILDRVHLHLRGIGYFSYSYCGWTSLVWGKSCFSNLLKFLQWKCWQYKERNENMSRQLKDAGVLRRSYKTIYENNA